jgi:S1-C subfamily serine protease
MGALVIGPPGAGRAAPPASRSVGVATLSQEVGPSLVDTIAFTQPAGMELLGTGIIVSSTGLILTDYHVIQDALYLGVTVGGQGGVYTTSVVTTDPDDDLALIQIDADPLLKPAELARSSPARVGDPVVAIGNAGGRGVAPTAAPGRLVALHRPIRYGVGSSVVSLAGTMEATAKIFPGDSGGALLDAAGRVIGVIAAGLSDGPCPPRSACPLPLAFAIPIDQALSEIGYTAGA